MNINWFPGHMAKAVRLVKENLQLVDVVIELLDARIPISSRNSNMNEIVSNKLVLTVLNKFDLADENINSLWKKWYDDRGHTCIFTNSLTGKGMSSVKKQLINMVADKINRQAEKGRIGRPVRTMIVGIPNVGKSAFINKLAGRAITITGDKPGVTKSKQWVKVDDRIDLLDTPGILPPKIDSEKAGLNLAFTGAIKDEILETDEIAIKLIEFLKLRYPKMLEERYKVKIEQTQDSVELIEQIGQKRGCLVSGGKVDFTRISNILLDEFRASKIGKISLENPEDYLQNVSRGRGY